MPNILDARGRSCPEPVIMTKAAIESNPKGSLQVLVDSHVAVENITRFVTGKGYNVNVEQVNEEFTLNIKK
ncbi:sulfurtransferase TusA family protein [Tissierella sp. MSJ-40]|uniref:Sulfurtransferase TusA family protein n=1 Tax=Tissierella simiarum TaxID=2841534 RepID=A0ABS6E735_9FIRM|nr:sulfurtransferase TusA family protein [Tissierella simiarum]MBU5438574.1 sulfurtransferase TusA family protein [Tissierella simiarum]